MVCDLCRSFSLLIVIGLLVGNSLSSAHEIPPNEVEALKIISAKLNNKYWSNISQKSCSDGGLSFNKTFIPGMFSNVTYDCSFNNNSTCHVTTIQMKRPNLSGVLPAELANLTHLQEIVLVRNYLNGSIPSSLAKLPLVTLALGGNHISGTIPEELSQISTLEEITVESNLLGGALPPALGNLNRLRRFRISGNNFTRAIPESFSNLKNLTELNMEGTSMKGPIPSTISLLKNLTELRITDLGGPSNSFPNLTNMKNLQYLVLRNCLITSQIPPYIGELTTLKALDLSFNMLTRQIPESMQNILLLDYMFLTNNSLRGPVLGWNLGINQNFDVAYNNFTGSASYSCQQSSNLINWRLKKDLPCPSEPKYHSLFINCGGPEMNYNRHEYAADTTPGGPSNFYASGSPNWAYSSTRVYLCYEKMNFIASNKFHLHVTSPEYYQTARIAPLSLKYYGVCLKKGSYKVQLHFAEIMFSDDETYSILGRRYFNVEIQGNLVLKNFDIAKETGGVGKGITRAFPDVHVNGSTLEIHLYWAGLGTTSIPDRGVYGLLISAITVTPNFKTGTGLSAGAIIGIVIGSIAVITLLLVALRMKGYLGGKHDENKDYQSLGASYFSLR